MKSQAEQPEEDRTDEVDDTPEERTSPVSTQLQVMNPRTGEIEALPQTLDDIARRDTGGYGSQVQSSIILGAGGYDKLTPEDKDRLSALLDADKPVNHIENEGWLGKAFKMVSYTSKGVLAKKDKNSVVFDVPKPLIRTVIEMDDGDFIITSSSYVFESIKQIVSFCGYPSKKNPILVKLVKGGNAFKLVRVSNLIGTSKKKS